MRALFVVLAIACSASSAAAQAINIDIGPRVLGEPQPTYGAAANQAGFWNLAGVPSGLVFLQDVAGAVTQASFFATGSATLVNGVPGGNDDEHVMMTTAFEQHQQDGAFDVVQLTPGWYDVYLYCWSGPGFSLPTINFFSANDFLHFTPASNGTWPGAQVEGETYIKTRLFTTGSIGFDYVVPTGGTAIISGLQLVPAPAPGTSGLLAVGGLVAARRRR